MKPARLHSLPEAMRRELKQARLNRGWSQLELGRRVGLPQAHISVIETGKTAPHFDTLLDLVRVLGRDLVMVPRSLIPAITALIRDHQNDIDKDDEAGEQPLYAVTDSEEEEDHDDDEQQHSRDET